MIFLAIVVFIIILGLLVFVHELGHFVMAKRAGMKVDEFGFGFPPRIFGIKKGDTVYSVNWIPLGGFVKIVGEDGSDTQDPASFGYKSFWQRFFVLVAGVTMNVILAWVILSIVMMLGAPTEVIEGEQLPKNAKVVGPTSVVVREIAPDSPASLAGLKIGDSIFKINGQEVDSIPKLQELTTSNAGFPTTYVFKRGSSEIEKTLTPRENPPNGEGRLGIALSMVAKIAYPWYEAPIRGGTAAINLIILTVTTFAALIGQFVQGQPVGAVLSGPVGIAVLTRDVTVLGFIYLMQFTAILSINLAIINAVPFPALDGGRILFLIIEKLRGRKMNARAETWANTVGFVLLLTLMVAVTVKDVSRYSEGFKNLFQRIF